MEWCINQIMFYCEATPIGEGLLCDNMVIAIAKGSEKLDSADGFSIDNGIEFLESVITGHKRMLKGPLDAGSPTQSRRLYDVWCVVSGAEWQKRMGPAVIQDFRADIEGKLATYIEALGRLKDGTIKEEDVALLGEQRSFFFLLGRSYLTKASMRSYSISLTTYL